MKTTQTVKNEIDQLLIWQDKRDKKKLRFLTLCMYYLESSPDKNFLSETLEILKNRHAKINDQNFVEWKRNQQSLAIKTIEEYRTEMGYSELTLQIKALNYILK